MPKIERRPAVAGSEQWPWPEDTHRVLRQVLCRRPIRSTDELALDLKHLTPVGQFDALGAAVELLCRHRSGTVVIVGDFDADGATSAALAYLTLRALGFADVHYFIPDRFELGYGLTPEVVARTRNLNPTLIVTVDNGITSVEGVEAARSIGVDVLITDHHLAPAVLPRANAIVNPNVPGDSFSGKHLAGVGVVFYLLAALGKALGNASAVMAHIDLVALGTVADLVSLDRPNRILVSQGLKRIRAGQCRPGLRELIAVAGAELRELTASTLGYQIGPRLNAAGRLDDMSVGVRCLVTEDSREARDLAAKLDGLNRERRQLETRMKAEAIELMDAADSLDGSVLPTVVCLMHREWHEGLVGLIASRVKDRYYRPTFAFAPAENGQIKGSGRSIAGFHLRDALAEVAARRPGLIDRFGGHAMAAGLTLGADCFEAFREEIEAVGRTNLGPDSFAEQILTDGEIHCEDLTIQVAALLRDAGPWGQGFPEPRFDGRFELVGHKVLKEAHVKMTLRPVAGREPVEAIAFNRAAEDWVRGAELTLVYRLDINDYFETPRVQLIVDHIE